MQLRKIGMVALLLIAFGLWVHNLDGMSLWRDEALSVHRARQPLTQIVRNVNVISNVESADLHPPTYFLLLNGWRRLVGESEFAYRLPSVLAMVLLVAIIGRGIPIPLRSPYTHTRRTLGQAQGIVPTLIVIATPFTYWYAREARMYALVAFGSAILVSLLLSKRSTFLLFITSLILTSLHYASLFLVGAVGLIWLIQTFVSMNAPTSNIPKANAETLTKSYTSLRNVLSALFAILGIAITISIIFTALSSIFTRTFAHFSTRPPHHLLWETFTTFMLGSAVPPDLNWLWFIPFILIALIGIVTEWRLGAIIALTILLAWLSSLIVPNYTNPRHLTVLFPVWLMALGVGISRLGRIRHIGKTAALIATITLIAITIPHLYTTITAPPIVKDDVRGAIAQINKRTLPNDTLIINDPMLEPLVTYYTPNIPWRTLPWWEQHDTAEMETVTAAYTTQFDRVWSLNAVGNENGVTDWLDDNLTWGSELYFDGSWQTLRVRNYRPPVTFEQPPTPYLLQVDGAAVYGVTFTEPLVEGKGVWINAVVNGSEHIERNEMCVELLIDYVGLDRIVADVCTSLRETDIHTLQLWLPLPLGLADVEYVLRVRLMNQTFDITTVNIEQTDDGRPPITTISNHELLGVTWRADQFTEGQWAIGELLLRSADEDTTVPARLIDWRGRTTAETTIIIRAHTAEDVVRTQFVLRLPFHQTGTRRLQINTGDDWKTIGRTRIIPFPKTDALPSTAVPLTETAIWQNTMQLVGYELVGDQLHLYWRLANDPIDLPHHVFIHIGTPGQHPNDQTSNIPAANTRPISSWRTGEIIKDTHTIPAVDGIIQIGWFDPADVNIRATLIVNGTTHSDLYELP